MSGGYDRLGEDSESSQEPLPPSNFADDPMTLLWRNADDRDTGAEAVETIRTRRRSLGPEDVGRSS